jgi:predicted polyphosphate/ATP-dependent NAD kinase
VSKVATVGVIANPASSRDVRRIVARGPATTANDKINMLVRLMEGLGGAGVNTVISMSDAGGIAAGLAGLSTRKSASNWPVLHFVDQEITHTPTDTVTAVEHMAERGVDAIVVLGGDGTNRLLIGKSGDIPVASISSGTNNAFPSRHEPTVVGLAVGFLATGRVDRQRCSYRAKTLQVSDGSTSTKALVDMAILDGDRIATGAIWDVTSLREVFLCFAEPHAIGLSSLGGRLRPVCRRDPHGLRITVDERSNHRVLAPIAPGLVRDIGVAHVDVMSAGNAVEVDVSSGVIALDGERAHRFPERRSVTVSLDLDGPIVLDVQRAMQLAAEGQQVEEHNARPHTTDPSQTHPTNHEGESND